MSAAVAKMSATDYGWLGRSPPPPMPHHLLDVDQRLPAWTWGIPEPVMLSLEQTVADVLPLHSPLTSASPSGLPDSGDQALGHLCHDRDPHGPCGLLHRHHGGELGRPEVQGRQGQYPFLKGPTQTGRSLEQSVGTRVTAHPSAGLTGDTCGLGVRLPTGRVGTGQWNVSETCS